MSDVPDGKDNAGPAGSWTVRCISLRPYRLLCLVCMIGEERSESAARAPFAALNDQPFWREKTRALRLALRQMQALPDLPVALCCNAGGVFAWQDPGPAEDSPEGAEFNLKRDLDALERLDLPPGALLPARSLLYRMQNHIKSVRDLCGGAARAPRWRGCPKAEAGFYERGNAVSIDEVIPLRAPEVRAAEKARSLADMAAAPAVRIRPHLLLCAVCQYGMGFRPPFEFDNLPEFLQHVLAAPQRPVTLAAGADWMMCAPCKRRDPASGACVNVCGHGGLPNDLRDLIVLQLLGLTYGATLPAGELFARLFERIPETTPVCTRAHARTSVWWDPCADRPNAKAYATGREELMRHGFGVRATPMDLPST
jgi:hypothetical protein